MTSIRELVEEGRRKLDRIAEAPAHEAEILLAAAIGRDRSYLKAHPEAELRDCDMTDRYEALLTRRSLGEPVAYLLGEQEFWSLPLRVGPGVLIPRPETELLVERSLAHLPETATAGTTASYPSAASTFATNSNTARPSIQRATTTRSGSSITTAISSSTRASRGRSSTPRQPS